MDNFPKVFIIILNYNSADVLSCCLSSVFRVNFPNFEVIVVDNNSQDGSLETARSQFPRCHCIKNSVNLGYSAGNNVGIKFTLDHGADWVLLLNSDTEVTPDFLSRLMETAHKFPRAGILSPLVYDANGKIWFAGGKINWRKMKTGHYFFPKNKTAYKSEIISGCAMMIKKEVFQKIGLLDEDFFLYWEDADFSLRARRAGYELLIVPASRIKHREISEQTPKNKVYWLVISGLIFFRKNAKGPWKIWIKLYFMGRKIKNRIDLKFKRNEMAPVVRKAYLDFKKHVG